LQFFLVRQFRPQQLADQQVDKQEQNRCPSEQAQVSNDRGRSGHREGSGFGFRSSRESRIESLEPDKESPDKLFPALDFRPSSPDFSVIDSVRGAPVRRSPSTAPPLSD